MWVVSGDDGPVPTYPVGRLAANAWGLHDMHGTLFQWCSDWYGAYGSGTQRDPRGPATGSQRVHRGGGWQPSVSDYRSAHRGQYGSGFRWFNLGLRLCIADR
jgi:formylglycine-generating enzyme required for sulfatase activity